MSAPNLGGVAVSGRKMMMDEPVTVVYRVIHRAVMVVYDLGISLHNMHGMSRRASRSNIWVYLGRRTGEDCTR